jgi:ketosteroid isomerase-like protein
MEMSTRQAMDEADIRRRIGDLVEAVRALDLEGVKSIYAPDLLSFDIEPPLQHVGAEAKWKNWAGVFAAYRRPLGYELRDLAITVGGDVAFARSLNRISGMLQNGSRNDHWVRWTACFRKFGDEWLIVHDHISVPLDLRSGKALLDLEPADEESKRVCDQSDRSERGSKMRRDA